MVFGDPPSTPHSISHDDRGVLRRIGGQCLFHGFSVYRLFPSESALLGYAHYLSIGYHTRTLPAYIVIYKSFDSFNVFMARALHVESDPVELARNLLYLLSHCLFCWSPYISET